MASVAPCGTVINDTLYNCSCGARLGWIATNAAGKRYMSWKLRCVTMNPAAGKVEMHGRCAGCNCMLIVRDLEAFLREILDVERAIT